MSSHPAAHLPAARAGLPSAIPDAISFAQDHLGPIERGLALKKTGNAVLELIGGRAIHPVNVRVGGFDSRAHQGRAGSRWRSSCAGRSDLALDTGRWVSGFDFPDVELDHEPLALHDGERYPIEPAEAARTSGRRSPPASSASM